MPPAKPRLPAVLQEQPHVAVFFIRGWLFVLGLLNDPSMMKGQLPTEWVHNSTHSPIAYKQQLFVNQSISYTHLTSQVYQAMQ